MSIGQRTSGATRPVSSPVLPCQQRGITGRFGSLVAKCGDSVALIASGTNIPDGTRVNFTIRHYNRGRNIATERATMRSSLVNDKFWITKKGFMGWEPPQVDFEVSAGGASADSMNRLRIHKYPDFPSYTKTIARTSTNGGVTFGWTGKYNIKFENFRLCITTKIKLINRQGRQPAAGQPLPSAGSPVSASRKRSMKRDIESKLSGKWFLHRDRCQRESSCNCNINKECCKFRVRIRVQFVETGEHHTVNLFQGSNRVVDATNWGRVKWRANDYAHETGHLLGWYDEYSTGAIGPAPWQSNRTTGIMSVGLQVPRLYYNGFKGEFRLKTDEPWELVSR